MGAGPRGRDATDRPSPLAGEVAAPAAGGGSLKTDSPLPLSDPPSGPWPDLLPREGGGIRSRRRLRSWVIYRGIGHAGGAAPEGMKMGPGSDYFDGLDRDAVVRRSLRRLENLGYTVTLHESAAA